MKPDWDRIETIVARVCRTYRGDLSVLEGAIGALILGQYMGYRVLRIIHSGRTYSRYERLLGVKFNQECPPTTRLSTRNNGYRWVQEFGDYWKAVSQGLIPSQDRRDAT